MGEKLLEKVARNKRLTMLNMITKLELFSVLLTIVLFIGCDGGRKRDENLQTVNHLKKIFLIVKEFESDYGRPPSEKELRKIYPPIFLLDSPKYFEETSNGQALFEVRNLRMLKDGTIGIQ